MTKQELIEKMKNGWIYIGQQIENDYFDGLLEDLEQKIDPTILVTIGEITAYRAILNKLEKKEETNK